MTSLLLQILPVAFIITINPVPIVAALVVSTTRRPQACGLAYVATLSVGMALFGALVLLVFGGSLVTSSGASTPFVRWAWLLIGLAFLVAFAVLAVRRPRPAGAAQPRWMGLVAGMGPLGAVVVGVLLVNYEMQTPAMLDILAADVAGAQAALALALFVVLACALPVAMVAAVLGAHRRSAADVDRAKAWLARYNRPVLLVLFAVVGAVYSTKGLLALIH
jgi:Sap, sulfolipid-1-addressing protein